MESEGIEITAFTLELLPTRCIGEEDVPWPALVTVPTLSSGTIASLRVV